MSTNSKRKPLKFVTTTDLRIIKENIHLKDEDIGLLLNKSRAQINMIRHRYKIPKEKKGRPFKIKK